MAPAGVVAPAGVESSSPANQGSPPFPPQPGSSPSARREQPQTRPPVPVIANGHRVDPASDYELSHYGHILEHKLMVKYFVLMLTELRNYE